jgi:hypothetical protein
MLTRLTLLLCAVAVLSSCAGDHADRQANNFPAPISKAEPVPAASVPSRSLAPAEVVDPPSIKHEDSLTSQNALQQGFSGMGVQLGKVADKFDASLLRVESNLSLNAKATAKLVVNLKSTIKVQNKAIANLKAQVSAVAQAQGTAQAAIGSKLESMQQTTSAGRDSTQNQFTREMRDTFLAIFRETIAIVAILALAMVLMQHRHHMAVLKNQGGTKCDPILPSQRSYRSL